MGCFSVERMLEGGVTDEVWEAVGSLLSSKIAFIPPVFVFDITLPPPPQPANRYSPYQSSKLPPVFSFFTIGSGEGIVYPGIQRDMDNGERVEREVG
jgi:hypothetical protein